MLAGEEMRDEDAFYVLPRSDWLLRKVAGSTIFRVGVSVVAKSRVPGVQSSGKIICSKFYNAQQGMQCPTKMFHRSTFNGQITLFKEIDCANNLQDVEYLDGKTLEPVCPSVYPYYTLLMSLQCMEAMAFVGVIWRGREKHSGLRQQRSTFADKPSQDTFTLQYGNHFI